MEKKAEQLFGKYARKYINKLGRHPLDNMEIDTLARSVLGTKYKGCYAQDEKFELKPGYYIINTDVKKGPGVHWISLVLTPKTAYMFDSFARDPKKLVPHLVRRLSSRKIVSSDRKDKEQKDLSVVCGHLSISFLKVSKELGIRYAIKI